LSRAAWQAAARIVVKAFEGSELVGQIESALSELSD